MAGVEFVQYLLPDGRRTRVTIPMPPGTCRKAEELKAAGVRLEAEVLTTADVSFTAERDVAGEVEVLAIEVVPNGPQIHGAVMRLLEAAHKRLNRG